MKKKPRMNPPTVIHVSSAASGHADGTAARPFATLEAAHALIAR